ncbi:MAG TPA: hypothetical protein VGE16_17705 [Albitalea sp.]
MFLECFAPIDALPPQAGFETHPIEDRGRGSRFAGRDHDTPAALPADLRSESFAEDLLAHAGSW